MISSWETVPSEYRKKCILSMSSYTNSDLLAVREIESSIHSISQSLVEYNDKIQEITFNLKLNPKLVESGSDLILYTNAEMAKNTIIEDIENETKIRKQRFEQMLQEKYEMLNDKSFKSTLKCRRCGSTEIAWEQKQTRGADEAMTVFCTCGKCNNRWTMR